MEQKFPIIVTAGAIQSTVFAALRLLAVLIGGGTAILGFVSTRDLAGLIAYVQTSDFTAVAGAIAALVSAGYGLWSTYRRKKDLIAVAEHAPDAVATVVDKPSAVPPLGPLAVLFLCVTVVGGLSACTPTANSVRLNSNKAFLTAQIALKSSQQTTLSVCSVPAAPLVEPCRQAIDLLRKGAAAEAAGFTAQQAGNAADVHAAIVTLTDLPAQLVALGILEKR